MKVSIDTKEDSHEEIRKVIRMLQNLVGDNAEIFTNQPASELTGAEAAASPIANIFGDVSASSAPENSGASVEISPAEAPSSVSSAEEEPQSTEDLFAELFSEEELKKMDAAPAKDEEEEIKPKDKKYDIEFY